MHKLAGSGKLLVVLVSLVPLCACFVGQGNTGNQQHAQTGMSATKSSAVAEDLVYTTSNAKEEFINTVKLSATMAGSLRRYSAGFKLWGPADYSPAQLKNYPYSKKSLPYIVKGDFNGDGIEDAAIAGHDQESNLILVLISSANADYHVLTVKEDKYYADAVKGAEIHPTPTDALVLKEKGTKIIEGDIGATVTFLKTDGFSSKVVSRFDRAAHTFRQSCTGINTYEYTGKFAVSYLGLVAESTTAISVPHPFINTPLSDEISAALRGYNRDFVLWKLEDYPQGKIISYPYTEKSSPYSLREDFNGDGKEDMVFSGHDTDANIIVALISTSSSYYPLEISRFPCYKLSRKHKKQVPFTPTDVLEHPATGKFIVKQINTWELEDPADDYSDNYKLTDLNGQSILYTYAEKFFKHDGPEDECIDKGNGTPW